MISDERLLPVDSFTYLSDSHNSTTWIDHCLSSASADQLIDSIKVLHQYLIFDHRPLLVLINCVPSYTCQDNKDLHTNNFKHINWPTLSSSKKVEYYQNTKLAMSDIPLPLNDISCQNPGCNDENHLESISQCYQRIVNCLQNSSAFLQVTKSKRTFRVPGSSGNLK